MGPILHRRGFGVTMFWKGLRLIILIGLLILNLRLYFPRPAAAQAVPREAYAELRYLKHALENGAGEEMQRLFPEGDFFTHVLYGLSWVNVGLQLPEGDVNRAMALSEARWAWAELGEQSAIAPFYSGQSLQPEIWYILSRLAQLSFNRHHAAARSGRARSG